MNITLKQVSGELHKRLRKQAVRNRRSLNMEALKILEQGIEPDLDQLFAGLRELHKKQKRPVTPAEIREAIHEGRE